MGAMAGVRDIPSSTPILDRIKPFPRVPESTWRRSLVGYIVTFFLMGFVVIPAGLVIDAVVFPSSRLLAFYLEHTFANQTTPAIILLFVLLQYAAAVVHEAGHFLAGLLARMRLNYIWVGPLELTPPFQLSLRWKKRQFLGMVSMTPVGSRALLWRELAMTCGGPLASFSVAAVVLFFQVRTQTFSPAVCMFVLIAAFQGMLTLVPASSRGVSWDGRKIMMLLFQKKKRERHLGILKLLVDLFEEIPLTETNQEILNKVLSVNDHSWETLVASSCCYTLALREKRDIDAGRFLETCLAHLDLSDNREEWFLQAVFFQALRRKRLDLAKLWIEEIPSKTQIPGLRVQAEAAILQGQNDTQGALFKLAESESLASRMAENSKKRWVLRSLQEWKRELETQDQANVDTCQMESVTLGPLREA